MTRVLIVHEYTRLQLKNLRMICVSWDCQNDTDTIAQCQIGLLFFPLHYFHSFRDGLGVKKSILQINLFSFCARIEPKLSKFQKTVKIDKKSSKNPCFLIVFRTFLILGSILAQKTTKCKYLSIVLFFCHPSHT